jgi:hypothetical protein
MRVIFAALFFATTVFAAPIYQPAFHGPLPGREHEFNLQNLKFQIQHVRHVDEQGRVTYIHDISDHRPDFCSMPGEEELCRLQIEAANNAPAVYDNDKTITIVGAHDEDELAPGHDAAVHPLDSSSSQQSDSHAADSTVTLENGDVITIHNENGHVRNINDGAVNMGNGNADGPAAEGGHTPNINNHPQSRAERVMEDGVPEGNVPHQRNIREDVPSDAPTAGPSSVSENSQSATEAPNSPFPGAFGPHTVASHPINKLQHSIKKQTQA